MSLLALVVGLSLLCTNVAVSSDWFVQSHNGMVGASTTGPLGPYTQVANGQVLRSCTWVDVRPGADLRLCKVGTLFNCDNYVGKFIDPPPGIGQIQHLRVPESPAFIDIWEQNSGTDILDEYGECIGEDEHCGLGVADADGNAVLADASVLEDAQGDGDLTTFRMDYDADERSVRFCNFPYSFSDLEVNVYEGPNADQTFILEPGSFITIRAFGPTDTGECLFDVACDVDPPPDAIREPESCGESTNGGCNSDPPVFTPMTCGETVHGTAWADGGVRDTDWYLIDVPDTDGNGQAVITADLDSEFPGVVFVLDIQRGECTVINVVGQGSADSNCAPGTAASASVPAPGTYAIFVATGTADGGAIFDGIPCETDNDYLLTVTCDGEGCPKDLTGDGVVNAADLAQMLGTWGPCPGCPSDFNGDGLVDAADLANLLGAWGPC